ncbi:hypothetical protein MLD38_031471 [Melastoma candidum]|uniref:Uncharacterized protein n=1 Tax=Melastoma candidum TaxID=119954 RepID=A0ACB9MP74_9MYRT|nr:hypothetical protein MLD38_031471 [Melastoma candidum]
MASSNSPCAACKFLRRKCTPECMFAPYFPADQPQKFANVHKVFGASNVQKLLAELPVNHREDAVNSLAYEAETRRRDPVYGCVGLISILQQRLKILQCELQSAHKELALYQGMAMQTQQTMGVPGFPVAQPVPGGILPLSLNQPPSSMEDQNKMAQIMGIPTTGGSLAIREPGRQNNNDTTQQLFNPEQLITAAAAVTREQQEMIRALEVQQQQHRHDVRFDVGKGSSSGVGVIGFTPNNATPQVVSPCPLLGNFDGGFSHHHFQNQLSLQPQQVLALKEHQMQEQEPPEEHPQGLNGKGEGEPHETSG